MSKLDRVLSAIDAANEADPDRSEGAPAARLYGERMTAELDRLFPAASDALRIAARGQHIERWTSPRASYPEGREGYLSWRRDLGAYHAARVAEIMAAAGYAEEEIAQTGRMIRKEGIKRDAEVQALEDVICFTFLRWYFAPFAEEPRRRRVGTHRRQDRPQDVARGARPGAGGVRPARTLRRVLPLNAGDSATHALAASARCPQTRFLPGAYAGVCGANVAHETLISAFRRLFVERNENCPQNPLTVTGNGHICAAPKPPS